MYVPKMLPYTHFAGLCVPEIQEITDAVATHRYNDPRFVFPELRCKPQRTRIELYFGRVPVLGWATFYDVCDEKADDVFSTQTEIEHPSGPAHKRLSLNVLIPAGCFADEPQRCARIAPPIDDVLSRLGEVALLTRFDLFVEGGLCGRVQLCQEASFLS